MVKQQISSARRSRRICWKFCEGLSGIELFHSPIVIIADAVSNLTYPAFLDHEISNPSNSEPSPKRAKLSTSHQDKLSISSKLESGAYEYLSTIRNDAKQVREELVRNLRRTEGDGQSTHPSVQDLKQLQRIQASEDVIKAMISREEMETALGETATADVKEEQVVDDARNGEAISLQRAGVVRESVTWSQSLPTCRPTFLWALQLATKYLVTSSRSSQECSTSTRQIVNHSA